MLSFYRCPWHESGGQPEQDSRSQEAECGERSGAYFSLEDPIPAAGHAVTVERSYYRIRKETVKDGSVKDTQTDAGALVSQGRDLTRRTLLKDGDVIASGDTIEVVMTVKTKTDVEYLMLRDPKPCLLYTSRGV